MKPETDDERILEMDDADRDQLYYYLDETETKESLITKLLEHLADEELEQYIKDSRPPEDPGDG
jgi:hypothetical protein